MIGARLAQFRITAKLGEGGMGEVYRAEDTKLGREVAIKVLPEAFCSDPERLARFEREARVLASLNHPAIAGIHEVGSGLVELDDEGSPGNTVHYLVMELAPGETLGERIGGRRIPVQEAIRIARRIAEALEVAHERNIIHRDLKPANVKVGPDGEVKVLDFGLAKIFEVPPGGPGDEDLTRSPTLTARMTGAGVILGTAAYMSPEQAKGEEADKRSDIWSFGVVLAEMLTGERPFRDESVSETLASVLKGEPDLAGLPSDLPPAVRRLLDRCLRKDPRERFHDIADVRLVLEDVAEGRVGEERSSARRRSVPVAAALVTVGVIAGIVGSLLVPTSEPEAGPELPPRRYVIEYGDMRASRPAISPDGNRVAYSKGDRIWTRDLRGLEALPVPGTEGGRVPFWSPDGEWLGFTAEGGLWKVRLDGTGRTSLTTPGAGETAGGSTWLSDGRIVFTTGSSELFEVGDRGGNSEVFAALAEGEADFHHAVTLPGDRGVLTVAHRGDVFNNIQLVTADGERREIFTIEGDSISDVVYSPTGHILFSRWPSQTGIWAVPFSLDELEVTGEPFPVAAWGAAPTVGPDGTMIYVVSLPPVDSEIVIVDRSGRVVSLVGEPMRGLYPQPAVSPDGRRVVVPVYGNRGWDLWSFDLEGQAPRRLTHESFASLADPVWSLDGREVFVTIWRSTDDFEIARVPASGGTASEHVVQGIGPPDFTRDGRTMVYDARAAGFNWNLWRRPTEGDAPGEALFEEEGWELAPVLSPDDRFMAYVDDGEIRVRAFPGMEGPWQVGSGTAVRWSPDGDTLYLLDGDDLMEVEIAAEPELEIGPPRRLFQFEVATALPTTNPAFDVTPDGEGFVLVRTVERPPGLVVVQNWEEAIE